MDVIILAGGLGTRLRTVVNEKPKCMAPVAGRPFISYLFQYLIHYNVGRVIISVGYLCEKIYEWVDEIRVNLPFEIVYVEEKEPLGTGGGIRMALEKATSDYVCILNGDTYFNVDLSSLLAQHIKGEKPITLALKPMNEFDRYGNVEINKDNQITAFCEKNFCENGQINGGVYIINRKNSLMKELPMKFSFEIDVLQPNSAIGNVFGCIQNGYFIDIGIPEDYFLANQEFPSLFCRIDDLDLSEYETVFIDRDGTINVHRINDYVKKWDEFCFLPGVLKAFKAWHISGKRIIIVTNQRGVGRGKMSIEDLNDIHEKMCNEIVYYGGCVDKIYCSYGLDNTDPMRKPNLGMIEAAKKDFPDMDMEKCVMIGDSEVDMLFAKNAGVKSFII